MDAGKIINKLPHTVSVLKGGVILKYPSPVNLTISKIHAQEGFYICDDNNQSFMYSVIDQIPKIFEGVVISRIYAGWVRTNLNLKK